MNAVHKINGLDFLTYQIKRIIRYIRIRLKTPSYNTFHPPQKTVLLQKRTFFLKKMQKHLVRIKIMPTFASQFRNKGCKQQ